MTDLTRNQRFDRAASLVGSTCLIIILSNVALNVFFDTPKAIMYVLIGALLTNLFFLFYVGKSEKR